MRARIGSPLAPVATKPVSCTRRSPIETPLSKIAREA